jgi:SAM-dependent methyltransferase
MEMPAGDVTAVESDEMGLYGKDYWFSHQEDDIGNPNLVSRARTDLPERCVHWLGTVLKYKLPPGRTLELGAAHGGFVAMLGAIGFESTGLELSPWIAAFARQTFGARMFQGPVEKQPVEPGSLDALLLMDVAEHLPDPLATLSHCLRLLKPDGIMVVQTPALPEGKSNEQLVAEKHYFLNHLRADEHFHLFSRRAARALFERIGAVHVGFEPAIFEQYDQFVVASRSKLIVNDEHAIQAALQATPSGRLMGALVDATRQRDYFQRECEARMKVIDGLVAEVDRLRSGPLAPVHGGEG